MDVQGSVETGTTVDSPQADDTSRKKKQRYPQRGKRYSPAERKAILEDAKDASVNEAAKKHGVATGTIYEWRRSNKRRNKTVEAVRDSNIETVGVNKPLSLNTSEASSCDIEEPPSDSEDPKEFRDQKIMAIWRQHPGYGPSQVRNMLKRDGFKVSVGNVPM